MSASGLITIHMFLSQLTPLLFFPTQPLPPIKFSASLPKEMVSIVIGRGGAKIQRIMDQSDANVAVEPLTPLFGRMRFKGSPGSIVKAQVS